jgi:hypothetical protein
VSALVRRLTRHGATDNARRAVVDRRRLHDDVELRLAGFGAARQVADAA